MRARLQHMALAIKEDFLRRWRDPAGRAQLFGAAAVAGWMLAWVDATAWHLLPSKVSLTGLLVLTGLGIRWWRKAKNRPLLIRRAIASVVFVACWQAVVLTLRELRWRELADTIRLLGGIATFLLGLAWTTWYVDRQTALQPVFRFPVRRRIWNPYQLAAWYYGGNRQKLHQSLGTFAAYALAFMMLAFILGNIPGCREVYEMPAGGGETKKLRQVVQVQKVVKRKYVINPYSSVIFNPPPLEDVKLRLQDVTQHRYQIGAGIEDTAGYAAGTSRGKVRLIRLEYAGGDWDQDMGVGSDLNLLLEYGIRTGQPVAEATESRPIAQLKKFPPKQSPPFLYITGQRGIEVSDEDVQTLRQYLLEKHGMVFADNGGSGGWHTQFFGLMQRVLPTLSPIRVPLDHPVHRVPYEIPFLPYVAPHGGKDAWGWVFEGRLVCYYHPGDIGDAWADGHAGVKREIWEYCYQLGVNIISYSHNEYNKWLVSQSSSQ